MLEKPKEAALTGCRVLDCSREIGALCVRTLAAMGAEVTSINPDADPAHFLHHLKHADVLVDACPPGYLDGRAMGYKDIFKSNPRLVAAAITPFGQNGPYKDLPASDLTLQAQGGWLYVTGTPDKPIKMYGAQAYKTASLFAANGILLALWDRHQTGRGRFIDISILECVAATLDHVLVRYFYEDIVSVRQGGRAWNNAFDIFPCADGFILLSIHRQWDSLVELLAADGLAEDLVDVKWRDREERNKNIGHITEVLGRWTKQRKAAQLMEQGQLMHFPWAAVKNG